MSIYRSISRIYYLRTEINLSLQLGLCTWYHMVLNFNSSPEFCLTCVRMYVLPLTKLTLTLEYYYGTEYGVLSPVKKRLACNALHDDCVALRMLSSSRMLGLFGCFGRVSRKVAWEVW